MRSKTHILKIMTRLLLLWMKNPWARLSQLIENCYRCEDIHDHCGSFYYVEDDKFISSLEDFYDKSKKGRGDSFEI